MLQTRRTQCDQAYAPPAAPTAHAELSKAMQLSEASSRPLCNYRNTRAAEPRSRALSRSGGAPAAQRREAALRGAPRRAGLRLPPVPAPCAAGRGAPWLPPAAPGPRWSPPGASGARAPPPRRPRSRSPALPTAVSRSLERCVQRLLTLSKVSAQCAGSRVPYDA